MSNELIINATQNGGRIALLRDKSLVEFHYDNDSSNFIVGDIFLGTVRRVVPGLNAAFIDIGYEKDAFLHYLDLGSNIRSLNKFTKLVQTNKYDNSRLTDFKMEPEIDKIGKISDVLKTNQQVMVQVVKEPISSKGPRLSCELSLAGRYIVMVPFANSVNVSKKVTDNAERKRLVRLLSSIKPENFGIIIRTVAEGKEVAELDRDLNDLLATWHKGVGNLPNIKPREKVIGEVGRANSMLRDMLNETFDSIVVDDKQMLDDIRDFIRTIAPDKEKIVKHYTGKAKLFEAYGIEKQLKLLFGPTVSLPSGGYLVIQHTEALHVIDVNSGNKSSTETNQENTAIHVNMEAVTEIARQLRLRDMGGIIVVDFIDMKSQEHKKNVYEHMRKEMKTDRAKSTVLPLSKFGLMQITRQRVRPELNIITTEKCPACNGTGKITASISVADLIESKLEFILTKQNESGVTLITHPYLFAYFTKGLFSIRVNWFLKYKKWIKMLSDTSLGITEFHFKNSQEQIIEIQ